MKMPHRSRRDGSSEGQAMTPMIDVVFLLLIFFVCAAVGQVQESTIATDLEGGTIETSEIIERDDPLPPLFLYLTFDPEANRTMTQLNEGGVKLTDPQALRTALFDLAEVGREEMPLVLDIADDVPAGDVIRIYDTCKQADFQQINFATKAPPGKGR